MFDKFGACFLTGDVIRRGREFLNQLCLELFSGDEYIRREIFFGLARYLDMQAKGGIYGPCDDRAARERF